MAYERDADDEVPGWGALKIRCEGSGLRFKASGVRGVPDWGALKIRCGVSGLRVEDLGVRGVPD